MSYTKEYQKQWRENNPELYKAQRERERLRHTERFNTEPEYAQKVREKRRKADYKRLQKRLKDPNAKKTYIRVKQQIINVQNMTDEERKEHKRKQKQKSYDKFKKKWGINYHTYLKYSHQIGVKNIRQVAEYWKSVTLHGKNTTRTEKFKAKYGISIYAYYNFHKRKGFDLESILKLKEAREKHLAEVKKANRISAKKIAKESINSRKNYLTYREKSDIRRNAYTILQNKINNLERLITDDSIRLPKIKELKDEYISIYGKLPI